MSEHPSAEPANPEAAPPASAHPWEVELLVSGATAFALLQLPSKLDAFYYDLYNRSPADIARGLTAGWIYLKTSLSILIVTFLLHLVLRGYWVALVGLNSIYPGGVRWEKFTIGPHQRAWVEKLPSFPQRIINADQAASFVFAIGFGLSSIALFPTAIVLLWLAMMAGSRLTGVHRFDQDLLVLVVFAFALPLQIFSWLDRKFGGRISLSSKGGRALAAIFAFYERCGLGRGRQPLLTLFRSHAGALRSSLLVLFALVIGMLSVVISLANDRNSIRFDIGHIDGLPDDLPEAQDNLKSEHYASLRGSEIHTAAPRPFIPELTSSGPYLQLFVPYRTARFGPALQASCPEAVAQAESGGSKRASLDCLAKLLDLHLDGAAAPVRFDAASDPVTDMRGVLAMNPVGNLAAGRHELTLNELAEVSRLHEDDPGDDKAIRIERIPFWR